MNDGTYRKLCASIDEGFFVTEADTRLDSHVGPTDKTRATESTSANIIPGLRYIQCANDSRIRETNV